MNYAISFNKKTAILIFAGGTIFSGLLFLSGYKLGFDRGAALAGPQKEAQAEISAASPASASPAPSEPAVAEKTDAASSESAAGSSPASDALTEPSVGALDSEEGYSVQIGTFQNEASALELQQKIARRGYSVYVFHGPDLTGKTWYAVRIGHFKDLAPATRAAVNFTLKEKLPANVRPDKAL